MLTQVLVACRVIQGPFSGEKVVEVGLTATVVPPQECHRLGDYDFVTARLVQELQDGTSEVLLNDGGPVWIVPNNLIRPFPLRLVK